MGGELLQIVLQGAAAALDKVRAGALALHRVLLRPRGDEVASVSCLQQVSERLQQRCCSGGSAQAELLEQRRVSCRVGKG